MIRAAALTLTILAAAPALALDLAGRLVQGGLVTGRTAPGATVALDGRMLRVSEDGRFVFGLGRDAAPSVRLTIVRPDGRRRVHALRVAKRRYDVQRIDGLAPRKVTPNAQDMRRIRAESARIRAARARDTAATWFASGFAWPVKGVVTGVYGSRRILNGEPRRPHLGIDIAAPEGTPVAAAAPGVVSLAEADLFFNGGTVIIDHGHGVSSVYSHLAAVEAARGDRVARGARIGTVGATGRATGPHLDWRVQHFATPVDPAPLAGPMPE